MTSCGFVDTILYTLTRRALLREIGDDSTDMTFSTADRTVPAHTVFSESDEGVIAFGKRSKKKQGTDPSDSTEDIWDVLKTESFEVRTDTLHEQRASASLVEEDR